MKKKYFILTVLILVSLITIPLEFHKNIRFIFYYDFFTFIIIFCGCSLLPFALLLNVFNQDIKRSIIFAAIFSFIFSFSTFYVKVENLEIQNERLRSNYEAALNNVIDLAEKNVPYYTDSFIEAFPDYYNYID